MRALLAQCVALALLVIIGRSESANIGAGAVLDCATFDAAAIRLVTFDVFAALMDTPSSLSLSVNELLSPYLNATRTHDFAMGMLDGYSSYANHTFTMQEVLHN